MTSLCTFKGAKLYLFFLVCMHMPVSVYIALNILGSDLFLRKKKKSTCISPGRRERDGGGGVADSEVFYPTFFGGSLFRIPLK